MQLPERIRVGPYEYKVSVQPNIHDRDGNREYGNINYLDGQIALNGTVDESRAVATFWHEVFHALDHCYSVKLSEQQTDQLGNALASFFLDNPELAPAWSQPN